MECKTCFLVLEVCFSYNTNKHITYHFIWLFDSKVHETFPGVTIDREWCETHEISDINTHLHYQAWTPNILETQLTKVCYICFKEVLQTHSIYTCHICSMLVYEQRRLRLMQCKCPKSKPNTWGVTNDLHEHCSQWHSNVARVFWWITTFICMWHMYSSSSKQLKHPLETYKTFNWNNWNNQLKH
jgi:hypothetical protein